MPPTSPTITRLHTDPPAEPVVPGADTSIWVNPPTTPLPHDPAVLKHGQQTLRLVLEVLGGRRPLGQIQPLLRPEARRYLAAHLATFGTAPRPPAALIGAVRMCMPHGFAAEISATYRHGRYIRAFAARFDLSAEPEPGWQLTDLRILPAPRAVSGRP
jgi:hypothetical protein